jgi:hypothetical protein
MGWPVEETDVINRARLNAPERGKSRKTPIPAATESGGTSIPQAACIERECDQHEKPVAPEQFTARLAHAALRPPKQLTSTMPTIA